MRNWWHVLPCALLFGACAGPATNRTASYDLTDVELARASVTPATSRTVAITISPPARARERTGFTGKIVDVAFNDADLHNAVRLLAQVGGINVVLSNEVSGTINLRLQRVPWDQVLATVVQRCNAKIVRDGDIYYVARAR